MHKLIKTTLLLLAITLPLLVNAQQGDEGYIRYLVTHNWAKKFAAVDYISKQQREKMSYVWGSRSEWKQFANFYFTPTESKYEDSDEKAEPDDEGYSWRKEEFWVKRDFATHTEHDLINLNGKNYIIQDSIWQQDWKILNEMKEVAGHVCMNATWEDTLKMQKVTAWFALDIPLSGGPERFCGLPGLILEVDINDGAMLISADKIEMKKLTKEMELPKKVKGKKVTEAEYRAAIKKHVDEKRKEEEPPFWGMRY